MIELSEQQRQAVAEGTEPIRVVDPATKREFFLVRAELFARLQMTLVPGATYPAVDKVFSPGWDDPKMAEYDNYEQHKR